MKKLLAIVISMAMIVAMMPVGVFAGNEGVTPTAEGTGYNGVGLPAGPDMSGTVVNVNTANAQYTLDGAYGSIDEKTIVFAAGTYNQLELGRATKYADSNTEYRIGSFSATPMNFDSFYKEKNSDNYSGVPYYIRNMSNVTFKAAQGADVNIAGVLASSGHHYGTKEKSTYDYVLEKNVPDTNTSYYLAHKFNNITFEGIKFTAMSDINTSLEETTIDGFTFRNCKFTTQGTEDSNGQAIRYYNENNNGKVKNLTVDNCEFNSCYQGVYTHKINGIKVVDSRFNTTGHNAIAIQSGDDTVNHGDVVITNNTFDGIGDRIIRFNNVGAGTQITIKNNKATDSGDSDGQVIKATSLADGITYDICGNAWGENKSIANDNLKDKEAVAKIDEVQYTDLQAAFDAASDGDTIKLLKDITVASIGKETKATDSKGNEITYYAIDKSITLDLNEKVLTTNQRYTTSIKGDEKKVNIINGSIEAQNLADITSALFNIKTGCELSMDNVKLSTNACALFPQGDAAKVVCNNSEIAAGAYAVATNASNSGNYGVVIELNNSSFTAMSAVFVNVPCKLDMEKCTVNGSMHGVVVRGGTAVINNSNITMKYEDDDAQDMAKYFKDRNWGTGNMLNLAAVTVGNKHTTSYQYLSDVTIKNSTVQTAGTNASLFPALYSYANSAADKGVKITYANSKFIGKVVYGSNNIDGKISDGLFSDEVKEPYLKEGSVCSKSATEPDFYIVHNHSGKCNLGHTYCAGTCDGDELCHTLSHYIPSTPADNVTNNTTDKNTTADLTPAVSNNKSTTTVDNATADKIVDKAVENNSTEVVIDATGNNTVASSEVGIPEKTVKELAEKTDAKLVIKTDNGKVDLDKAAVKAVADQAGTTGTVKLIVETVKNDADICHVNLKLVTSNGAVTDFKGGNVKVTINLTKELAAKELVCVYIDDNGIYTLVDGVLNADGTYTFTTGHFSEYAVMAKAEADKKIAEQLNTLIKEVNLKVRTSKTAKKNIKAVVSGDVKALTDAGYTVKYKFYRSEKKASKYEAKATKAGKTYINTAGKKGTKYYYKAKAMVYSGDTLVGQTVLTQCKYGVRTWSK